MIAVTGRLLQALKVTIDLAVFVLLFQGRYVDHMIKSRQVI